MQWSGKAWTVVPSPDPTADYLDAFLGVVSISDGDAWAVGHDILGVHQHRLLERPYLELRLAGNARPALSGQLVPLLERIRPPESTIRRRQPRLM